MSSTQLSYPRTRRFTWRRGMRWLAWAAMAFFAINLFATIGSVLSSSFATQWFDSWLPSGWTTNYYGVAWNDFQLGDILKVTLQVAFTVVAVAIVIGAPAAYALARRNFPGKKILMLCFLLPIMVPPITYGVPLATLLYKLHLGGTLTGVIVANTVPTVPFVILVLTPFIEQIDPKIEASARMCGASTFKIFTRIVTPLLIPGLLAAALLVLVQTLALFELTFLVSGPDSQTLVVALYYAIFASGIRPTQAVNAMAIIYMMTTMVVLIIALRYISPTQLVAQVPDSED